MFHTFANSEGMDDGSDDWYRRQWEITEDIQDKYKKDKIDNFFFLIFGYIPRLYRLIFFFIFF
jgi:hypothetical protein